MFFSCNVTYSLSPYSHQLMIILPMSYDKSETEFLEKIGQRIRTFRETKDMSQEKLSFKCSLHRTYISSVERGERNISIINLAKISTALEISLAQIFDGIQYKDDER